MVNHPLRGGRLKRPARGPFDGRRASEGLAITAHRDVSDHFGDTATAAALRAIGRRWRTGKLQDVDAVLKQFIRRHRGCRVSLTWPPGFCLEVGRRRDFGVRDCVSRLRRFRCFRGVRWIRFMGVVQHTQLPRQGGPRRAGAENEDGVDEREERVWVMITDTGRAYGYQRLEDRVYLLCDRLSALTVESVRVIPDFYCSRYCGSVREIAWFGADPSEECRRIMDEDPDPYNVILYAGRLAGRPEGVYANRGFVFVPGTAFTLRVRESLPECLLTRLTEEGYVFIGLASRFSRYVLIRIATAAVYVLLGRGFVFKAADCFAGFLRGRLRALARGRVDCFLPTSNRVGDDYVPVGTQIRVCRGCRYRLPGDEALLRHWVSRYTGISGWPSGAGDDDRPLSV